MDDVDSRTFAQPPQKAQLWRYMDFAKLLSIFENSAIPFVRLDSFDDPFEGSIPTENYRRREAQHSALFAEMAPTVQSIIQTDAFFNREFRKLTYVSCWHENEDESDAMWKLYAQAGGGVAVGTTYEQLLNIVPRLSTIGRVEYIDYEKETIDESNRIALYMHKRKSFAHECEVRAIFQNVDILMNPPYLEGKEGGKRTKVLDTRTWEKLPKVKFVKADVDKLINGILISPVAPGWYEDLLKSILERYGVKKTLVRTSKLCTQEPNW